MKVQHVEHGSTASDGKMPADERFDGFRRWKLAPQLTNENSDSTDADPVKTVRRPPKKLLRCLFYVQMDPNASHAYRICFLPVLPEPKNSFRNLKSWPQCLQFLSEMWPVTFPTVHLTCQKQVELVITESDLAAGEVP